MDDISCMHIGDTLKKTKHNLTCFKVSERLGLASLVFEPKQSLELAASDQLHLDDYEFLIFKDAF